MTPPRLAAWLVSRCAAAGEREDLLADLAEEADAVERARGVAAARRWYWRQTRQSLVPLLARRCVGWTNAVMPLRDAGPDLRVATRSLAASPLFSLSIVLLLGVGIGVHVVVYAVVDGLLLRPMPFGDRNDRLFAVHGTHPTQVTDWHNARISYPDLADFRRQTTAFDAIEGVINRNVAVSAGGDTERVLAASITPGLFSTLGVAPIAGRDFTDTDGAEIGFESVALISHGFWQSMLGGNPRAVGQSLWINGRPLSVIGIMPPGFSFPDGQRLWLPFRDSETNGRERRNILGIALVGSEGGRLQAAAALQAVATRLSNDYPATNRDWGVRVMPLRQFFVSGSQATTLLGAVTLILLVVCANVAGLFIARGLGRQRELNLRAALGAGRWRLVRLLLMEVVALAIAGGLLGLAVATWAIRAANAWNPEPPPYWARPELDPRVALFAVAITASVAMLSGLLPAIRLTRADPSRALLPGTRTSMGTPGQRRAQQALIVAQVAVSFPLLLGAGLLSRTASELLHADGGFDPKPLLSLRLYIPGTRYDAQAARGAVVSDIVARVAEIPSVRAAGATGSIPTDDGGSPIRIVPPGLEGRPDRELGAQLVPAGPTFWQAIGRSLSEGRTFTSAEAADANASVAIVNERLAARLWPRESAVDRTLTVADAAGPIALRVIGVAPNLVYEEFGEETSQSQLNVYVPTARAGWRTQALLINVKTEGDLAAVTSSVRDAIRRVDPAIAVYDVMTMTDRRAYNHWGNAFLGRMSSAFAIAALLLACLGGYAIVAHGVVQRTREIGLRIALGSTTAAVTRLFVGTGGRLAAIGVCAGAVAGAAMVRWLDRDGDLFRTSPWTPDLWVMSPVVLIAALMIASYLPARRASRIDPAVALRGE